MISRGNRLSKDKLAARYGAIEVLPFRKTFTVSCIVDTWRMNTAKTEALVMCTGMACEDEDPPFEGIKVQFVLRDRESIDRMCQEPEQGKLKRIRVTVEGPQPTKG